MDVRVQNRSSKAVRRIELQLERSIFIYAYAAPSVDRGLGDTLRLPDKYEKDVICNTACPGWQVAGGSQDLKTCGLFVPSGLVSVDAGKSSLPEIVPYIPHLTRCFSIRSMTTYPSKMIEAASICRAHPSVGRFFGVRFFLNVRVRVSFAYAMLLYLYDTPSTH